MKWFQKVSPCHALPFLKSWFRKPKYQLIAILVISTSKSGFSQKIAKPLHD
jgi:hypothetical protein